MSLPFLPGFGAIDRNNTTGKRQQGLIYKNGYAIPRPAYDPSATQSATSEYQYDPALTYGGVTEKPLAPTKFQRENREIVPPNKAAADITEFNVMSFEGYFIEQAAHTATESERIRKVTVNYFLEDNTILVKEKRQANSGIVQGVLIKRQKIPKPDSTGSILNSTTYYTAKDFNVGLHVNLFAKDIHLINCDFFTKNYLTNQGVTVGEGEDYPFENTHRPQDTRPASRAPADAMLTEKQQQKHQLRNFLLNDGKVLRFYAYWDNRQNVFGEIRPFIIHYFLVDNTVEVRAVQSSNSGHLPFTVFLKRQKLPKGSDGGFHTDRDLQVGGTITVFGRTFFLYDADVSTKEYYKQTYGITITPIQVDFGTSEDTASATASSRRASGDQELSGPKKNNFQKMLDNDGKILRFAGSIESDQPEHQDRLFVVSFYLADDTMGIYEPPQRNSGIVGGKFLERRKVPRPETANSPQPVYYKASDFYVGGVIECYGHRFVLHDADEYAFNHMEAKPDEFPKSNLDVIQQHMQEVLQQSGASLQDIFRAFDTDNSGYISLEEFRNAVIDLGFNLTEQEIITLIRRYDLDGDGHISYEELGLALSIA